MITVNEQKLNAHESVVGCSRFTLVQAVRPGSGACAEAPCAHYESVALGFEIHYCHECTAYNNSFRGSKLLSVVRGKG